MLNSGDKVLINGKEYTLGKRLGGGLEGNVFDVEGKQFSSYAIKIINDDKFSNVQKNDTYKHLKWLYDLGSRNEEIRQVLTLPKALLDDHLGYIMRKADEHTSLKDYLEVPDDIVIWYKEKYTLKKRYQIIVNIFRALRELHFAGLVFTDLSPNNIMVHKEQNQIVFIDTDNTRNRMNPYLGVLGTPGYMAPEVYRKPDRELAEKYNVDVKCLSNCGRITPESDIFSAAIIAFQLLTLQHPFIGDEVEEGEASLEEAALEIRTDYIFKKGTNNRSTRNLVPWFNDLTTPLIRNLFERTFVEGKNNPALRPTDEDFLEAFQNALDLIVECPHCGFSKLYSFEEKNQCISCGEIIGPKVVMIMYNYFSKLKRNEVINAIGNHPHLDINLVNLKDENGNNPVNFYEVTRIVLEPGEEHAKFLYLRHFESNTERSKQYAKVTLSDAENSVKVEIRNNAFENPYLIEKNTKEITYLGKGKENIRIDKYGIIFDSKKLGKGELQIFCKFIKA